MPLRNPRMSVNKKWTNIEGYRLDCAFDLRIFSFRKMMFRETIRARLAIAPRGSNFQSKTTLLTRTHWHLSQSTAVNTTQRKIVMQMRFAVDAIPYTLP
jgi:hypothetical protein